MSVIYRVAVEPGVKENSFRIIWQKMGTGIIDSFVGAAGLTSEDVRRFCHHPSYQLEIGRKLFRFLDGDSRYFQRALREAEQQGEMLQLHLYAGKETSDWPFELLAEDITFLLPHRVHLVRGVSDWVSGKEAPPVNRPLKLLFMASSAVDVEPELDFEREEERIFKITENLHIDIEMEDSGSLAGLRWQLERNMYDVVHLSGHADVDKNGAPYFIMEDETGHGQKVYPPRLWQEALIENPPRLLLLSGSRSGQKPGTPGSNELNSFGLKMVEGYGVQAVLAWGRPAADEQVVVAARILYHELSRGRSILDAMQRVRYELIKEFPLNSLPVWPWLRLFSSGTTFEPMVTKDQPLRIQSGRMAYGYPKQKQVQVSTEGFIGRRRNLQQCMRTLYHDASKVGVLLLGTAGIGKSCLAGKLTERFTNHTLILVPGPFNAISLEAALMDAFIAAQDEKSKQILAQKMEMTQKLTDLCAASFKERNYLLLLDGFDVNLAGAEKGQPGSLLPEAAELLETLLYCLPYSGKMTQLVITSRYNFFITAKNRDLVKERLDVVLLSSFQASEQRNKVRELKHIFNYPDQSLVPKLAAAGQGNPRLMEWIDLLVGEMTIAETPQLLEAIKDKKEEFIRHHVLQELVQRGGKKLEEFLQYLSIYRRPVLERGIQQVAKKRGLKDWRKLLKKAVDLSLVEFDQVLRRYQVTPLLQEEWSSGLEVSHPLHEAAFVYYKKECETRETIEPIRWEEWIFHALNCGEENVAFQQGGRLVKHLRERLAFRESQRIGEWILARQKRKLSTGDKAYLLNELAITIRDLGDYHRAIEYYKQALTIWKKIYGEKHPDVAYLLNNLGSSWEALGDYPQAIGYYEHALAAWEKIQGERHPQVAAALNNLGVSWNALGEKRKAIEYFKQALDIWKEVHGEEHPQIAVGLNNLGLAWNALGESRRAIEFYEQALTIDKAVYGEEHPDLAIDFNNLGSAWEALGEYRRAIGYYEKALSIDRAVYGEMHPNIAARLNNLGSVWEALGLHQRALEYYEQAQVIWEAVYGEKHPQVAAGLNNLGSVYYQLGQKEKARDYFEKAYIIFNQFFGPGHPHTKSVAQWLTAGRQDNK